MYITGPYKLAGKDVHYPLRVSFISHQQNLQSLPNSEFLHGFCELLLTLAAFVGVENILGSKESDIYKLDESQYQKWLEICYQLGKDENLMGTSEHYLYIGRK